MKKLSDNWIAEGLIDFEYKKYLLLAYLQDVQKQFGHVKLYPTLADLIQQHQRLESFRREHSNLRDAFPKKFSGADFKDAKLIYEKILEDGDLMKELESIVEFAIPQLWKQIEEGKSIYDFIEQNLEIEPVGIRPIYQREGYAFLSYDKTNDIYIYRYKVNLFENSMDSFRSILLNFVKRVRRSLVNTVEKIKLDLSQHYQELPNPAAWRIHSKHQVPLQESLVPISKRLLLQYVS
ncbi:MAG TPA: hypothetical protein VK921_10040 [Anditalea sp.]|nr:hypothetical protein [Anditalea sp.]